MTLLDAPKNTTLRLWRQLAHRATHVGDVVVDADGGVTEQRRIRVLQHGSLCKRSHWTGWPTRYVSWSTRLTCEPGQTVKHHEGCLSAVEAAPSNT